MEFKSVKIVDSEEKSTQEIEQELVAKHEKEQGIESSDGVEKIVLKQEVLNPEVTSEDEVVNTPVELDDESVLSHIRKKFGREELSYDDLLQKEIVEKELSEDIEALRKYKQETGRGIEDFVKLNRNLDNESPDAMIAEYILSENPEFDEEDVAFEMEREFSYDEDLDDDMDIRSKKLAKKKMLAQAKSFFSDQQEKYKAPLESRDGFISNEEKDLFNKYKQSTKQQSEEQELNNKKSQHFSTKTNELFSNNFEGFGYNVGDENITFKVSDINATKEAQSNAGNFVKKHLDENGMLKDANAYHKALNAAMDPDALFKFAYEKGAADAITKDVKEAKNVDMKAKTTGQSVGSQSRVRVINSDSGSRLVIKSRK